jgi:hypothetical protein
MHQKIYLSLAARLSHRVQDLQLTPMSQSEYYLKRSFIIKVIMYTYQPIAINVNNFNIIFIQLLAR